MISGDIIRAKTNAELLNALLGTHYQAWMKSVYEYANRRIWMIHIDNKNRNDWKNYKKGNIIVEENLRKYDFNGLRIDVRHNVERIVFSKKRNDRTNLWNCKRKPWISLYTNDR